MSQKPPHSESCPGQTVCAINLSFWILGKLLEAHLHTNFHLPGTIFKGLKVSLKFWHLGGLGYYLDDKFVHCVRSCLGVFCEHFGYLVVFRMVGWKLVFTDFAILYVSQIFIIVDIQVCFNH